MKGRAFIPEVFLPSGESTKVLYGLGHSLAIKSDDNSSQWLIAMRDIKEDLYSKRYQHLFSQSEGKEVGQPYR